MKMKIYFTASMRKPKTDSKRYKEIIAFIEELGHTNVNFVHSLQGSALRAKIDSLLDNGKMRIFDVQQMLINDADVLVADISHDSVTVGYQVDYAIRRKKPVLVMFDENIQNRIPLVFRDDHLGLLSVKSYSTIVEQRHIINQFLNDSVSGKVKFNFFISIPIHNYITQRASRENKKKSEIIREILFKEMERNPL